MRKKHWWILLVLAILVALALIALDERLILRTYTVVSPKLTAEVRLAVVTDFHSSDNAEEVAAMVASCAPDAVLLVGDLFDDDTANRPTERTLSLMRQLSAQYRATMCPATTRHGRARWTRSISRQRKRG